VPNVCPRLQTGDIVCFGDQSWLSRSIKWFTRQGSEEETKCSHVGVMYDRDRVCEALARVVITAVKVRLTGGWREVYRPIGLRRAVKLAIRAQCDYYKGKKYGWWKNIAQAADGLIGGRYFFRRLLRMDNYPICSWLVAWVFERCAGEGYFGVVPNAATPDDIHDACLDTERFELVYTTEESGGY